MAGILNEFKVFSSQTKNVKTLLVTNLLFAMVLPIVEIFSGAYIMSNTSSATYVVYYQLCMYIGIVITALLNGLLLKKFRSSLVYGFGIILSALSLMFMMFMSRVDLGVICLSGFFIGLSTGFFWTNRYLLTLYSTDDAGRNYFFGFESFFFSFWNIVIPLVVGAFLGSIEGTSIFGHILAKNNGYQIVTVVALLISICACVALSRGEFKTSSNSDYFHVKFHPLWVKFLALSGLKGMVQGFLVTAPAILVLKFLGGEGELGLIQGIAGAFTAVLVYVLGRIARPQDRMKIFGAGLFIFFIGTLLNSILFSGAGVIGFMICKVLFQPLHDLAYYPTEMKTIDAVSKIEKRNGYTYIMTHEVGMFIGRAFGMVLFIVVAALFNDDIALRYVLLAVAAIQLLSLPLAQHIIKEIDTKHSNNE
ncbi:MAG: MFS transporter [Bacteroidales bacterium]|nr:MFS transporter [Bacteroidales bacterium]